jgi:anti-anti-sigma factor
MAITCEVYNQVCVLTLGADFISEEIKAAKAAVDESIEKQQIVDFVFDFDKAAFVDSEGLEALLLFKRRCEEHFGQVKLVNLDENCRKILEVTRLEHRFECHGDLAAALKTMR